MSRRTEMLGSMIQRELAMIILHELDDPRLAGFPSITHVRVSPDLSIADVYVTVMGTEGVQTAALNALRHSAGLMRSRLNDTLSLRQPPFLKFHLDEQIRKELAVLEALRKVELESKPAEEKVEDSQPTEDSQPEDSEQK